MKLLSRRLNGLLTRLLLLATLLAALPGTHTLTRRPLLLLLLWLPALWRLPSLRRQPLLLWRTVMLRRLLCLLLLLRGLYSDCLPILPKHHLLSCTCSHHNWLLRFASSPRGVELLMFLLLLLGMLLTWLLRPLGRALPLLALLPVGAPAALLLAVWCVLSGVLARVALALNSSTSVHSNTQKQYAPLKKQRPVSFHIAVTCLVDNCVMHLSAWQTISYDHY